jgi:hypothetical protein
VENAQIAAQHLDFVVLTYPFTRERSKVRSLVRPPFKISCADISSTFRRANRQDGTQMGAC